MNVLLVVVITLFIVTCLLSYKIRLLNKKLDDLSASFKSLEKHIAQINASRMANIDDLK